jgi:hypothetical protein
MELITDTPIKPGNPYGETPSGLECRLGVPKGRFIVPTAPKDLILEKTNSPKVQPADLPKENRNDGIAEGWKAMDTWEEPKDPQPDARSGRAEPALLPDANTIPFLQHPFRP